MRLDRIPFFGGFGDEGEEGDWSDINDEEGGRVLLMTFAAHGNPARVTDTISSPTAEGYSVLVREIPRSALVKYTSAKFEMAVLGHRWRT